MLDPKVHITQFVHIPQFVRPTGLSGQLELSVYEKSKLKSPRTMIHQIPNTDLNVLFFRNIFSAETSLLFPIEVYLVE